MGFYPTGDFVTVSLGTVTGWRPLSCSFLRAALAPLALIPRWNGAKRKPKGINPLGRHNAPVWSLEAPFRGSLRLSRWLWPFAEEDGQALIARDRVNQWEGVKAGAVKWHRRGWKHSPGEHIRFYVTSGEGLFNAWQGTYIFMCCTWLNIFDIHLVRNGTGKTFERRRLHHLRIDK